jgi:His/Glu/Gln/Arg/opine family amino acid ABC transporter permease subunit
MNNLVDTFFNLAVMRQYLPQVIQGVGVTVLLAAAVVATGLLLGFALAVLRSLRIKPLNLLIVLFADVFRAVPALVILIIIYFALPTVGIRMSGFVSAWLGLSLVLAAFAEEIVWAGILIGAAWTVGSGACHRSGCGAVHAPGGAAAGAAADCGAADQPCHRHHQEHRAGLGAGGG